MKGQSGKKTQQREDDMSRFVPQNIGFDFDRVLVNYPPFVPAWLIDWLYRRHDKKTLTYRIPHSKTEQTLRKISHFHLFRPKISTNTNFIYELHQNHKHHNLYLISSRYKFLEKITHKLLRRYHLADVFSSVNLNTKNEQPHLFKEKAIKRLKINLYIDDDLDLLKHLHKTCPKTKFFWYNPTHKMASVPSGIIPVTQVAEIQRYLP